MATSPRQHISKTKPSLTSAGLSSDLVDTLTKANTETVQVWLEGWLKVVSETTNFTRKRCCRDAEFVQRLLSCKTSIEVMELQAEFIQTAMKEYIEETTILADMETDIAVSSIKTIDRGVQKATRAQESKADRAQLLLQGEQAR